MKITSALERKRFLGRVAALVALIIAVNISLQRIYSDFWLLPVAAETKLGVVSYELLILLAMCSVVMSPVYLLFRCGLKRTAGLLTTITAGLLMLLMVSSWYFFGVFDRFLGTYAFQMLIQDGNQILGYLFILPSLVEMRDLAAVGVLVLVIVFISVSTSKVVHRLHNASFYAIPCIALFALVVAALFDSPEKIDGEEGDWGRHVVESVRDNEYVMLKQHAGPFSGFLASALTAVITRTTYETVDTTKLKKRNSESLVASADIKKHNVVFVIVESMRPDVLGVYGADSSIMPTVDELGSKAYVFNRAYSQASHSNYAYISAMSGQYPLRSRNIHFYPKEPTYPKSLPYDVLKPLEYQVGLFGSHNDNWGNMSNYLSSPSVDMYSHVGSDSSMLASGEYSKVEVDMSVDGRKGISFDQFMYQSASQEVERLDGETTDIAINWLKSNPENSPFFLYINLQAGHQPFTGIPADFERKFLTSDDEDAQKVKKGDLIQMPMVYVLQSYWDAMNYVDSNIAKVVEYLKHIGQHENTIYVVTSDTSLQLHGTVLGNGGALNPEVLNIPLLIATPGQESTEIVEEAVAQIDIMPTVLSTIGVGPHPASQGQDVITRRDSDRLIFSVAQTPVAHQYSLIYRDWQLIYDDNLDKHNIGYLAGVIPEEGIDPELTHWMAVKLSEWRREQIAYYSDESVHSAFYPPQFNESFNNELKISPVITAEEQLE